jgi:hypothetical protein
MAAAYESELTAFLRSLKQSRPQIEAKQSEGRALWWDRRPDPDDQRRWQASRVPQGAYVYYDPESVKPGSGS